MPWFDCFRNGLVVISPALLHIVFTTHPASNLYSFCEWLTGYRASVICLLILWLSIALLRLAKSDVLLSHIPRVMDQGYASSALVIRNPWMIGSIPELHSGSFLGITIYSLRIGLCAE